MKTRFVNSVIIVILLLSAIDLERIFLCRANENIQFIKFSRRNIFQSLSIQSMCMAAENPHPREEQPAVLIENNKLYQNVLAGIRIKGSTPVVIRSCDIFENGRGGMDIGKESNVRIAESKIFNNGRGGVNIEDAAAVTIINSRIHNNNRGGMRIQKRKTTTTLPIRLENNSIYLNDDAGVRCQPEPGGKIELLVNGNRIFENSDAGIRLENDTFLTAKLNNIHHNGTAGIIAHESTNPPIVDIYRNTVSFNGGPGIHLYTAITGQVGIRNNWIYDNKRSGIICGFRDTPLSKVIEVDIFNNTIVGNGSEDQGSGVRNDSNGRVSIINNIIAYNYVAGIRTESCDDYSYNLNFANGNVATCCDDPYSAPFYVEKVQYAGCPGRGKGDLITDPLFVDSDNYNFTLQQNSPARDAGKVLDPHLGSQNFHSSDMGATGGPYSDQRVDISYRYRP